jgi:hypothetical protein
MRKSFFATLFVVFAPLLIAQQAMNNDSVIKLCKAGLSDDLIISTVKASPGNYDISADGVIALKKAGASDKVVSAVVNKTAIPASAAASSDTSADNGATQVSPTTPPPVTASSAKQVPRVFLQSASKGNQWNAVRDQSMEMSKDFEKDCAGVKITVNQQAADYTILLNHIEVGFMRDNQFQIANKEGDLISKTKEGGSIAGGVKKACKMILDDWAKK